MDDARVNLVVDAAGRLFAGTGIVVAYAYGSRVHGAPRPDSDLDVGYYLREWFKGRTLPIRQEMLLASSLSDWAGVEVDLRNLGRAPLELRGRVLEEGVRVFIEDEVERVNLERDLLGRYHDYKEGFALLHERRLSEISRTGL